MGRMIVVVLCIGLCSCNEFVPPPQSSTQVPTNKSDTGTTTQWKASAAVEGAAVNYALYCRKENTLPPQKMQVLVDDVIPEVTETERGTTYTYRWPDLMIIVCQMPAAQLAEHLEGFEGYIRQHIYKGKVPPRGERIIRNIRSTRMVVGVEFHPIADGHERAEELLGRMSGGLRPVIFHADTIFDWMSRVILAPDASFDPDAELE